ncbi:hypothetical protein [Nonlabens sp.]|uniref:hypothetical protein n=1 Tax=Nonlabens sp. TaxID=1888209 RepID=UPI003F699FF7
MLKYLQRILGKPSHYYESLMRSRDPQVNLTENAINQVVEKLKEVTLPAYLISSESHTTRESPIMPVNSTWPLNKKNRPLTFKGTVSSEEFKVCIFEHEDGLKKDPTNLQIFVHDVSSWDQLEVLAPSSKELISENIYIQTETVSLPIWEEIIHRFPEIHKLIVNLSPDHPWTLYKLAKQRICPLNIKQQFLGYPQWRINDVDFRKIKLQQFILQLQDSNTGKIIYLFTKDHENHIISQAE